MFLMPAKQGYERSRSGRASSSCIDVSDSHGPDQRRPAGAPRGKPVTRLAKVMDYLSDEKIGLLKALLDKNPVYVYRFGNRLDEEPSS